MYITYNVRIDDFCILSGVIQLGNYIHISVASLLYGGKFGIEIKDFSTISYRSAIYAMRDDYSGFIQGYNSFITCS